MRYRLINNKEKPYGKKKPTKKPVKKSSYGTGSNKKGKK
tara:strand:- start:204 stop:320 length:117 start_codon:yes stop_codon:yes gene_type:complete